MIDAAIRLLADRGYAGTTLAEIGREAGVSRGLVTHHFGSKELCIEYAIDSLRDSAAEHVRPPTSYRGLSALDYVLVHYAQAVRDGHAYARAMYVVMTDSISQAPQLRDAVARTNAGFREHVANLLREARVDGEIGEILDMEAQTIAVTGIMRGVCLQWLVDPTVDLDSAVEVAQQMVRASLPLAEGATNESRHGQRNPRRR